MSKPIDNFYKSLSESKLTKSAWKQNLKWFENDRFCGFSYAFENKRWNCKED